jgi:thiamine biosynthesis protein ThiS
MTRIECAVVVHIKLNGEPFQLDGPMSVAALLSSLDIDPRRVAVEHNLVVVKRLAFATTEVGEGDEVEIVNFVGGG